MKIRLAIIKIDVSGSLGVIIFFIPVDKIKRMAHYRPDPAAPYHVERETERCRHVVVNKDTWSDSHTFVAKAHQNFGSLLFEKEDLERHQGIVALFK